MEKFFKVKNIYESDYGCEDLGPGEEPMVDVILEDENGNERIFKEKDSELYKKNIEKGDRVLIDKGELIKIQKKKS